MVSKYIVEGLVTSFIVKGLMKIVGPEAVDAMYFIIIRNVKEYSDNSVIILV